MSPEIKAAWEEFTARKKKEKKESAWLQENRPRLQESMD